jgi:hypothetical protein
MPYILELDCDVYDEEVPVTVFVLLDDDDILLDPIPIV